MASAGGWDHGRLVFPSACPQNLDCPVCLYVVCDAVQCKKQHICCGPCFRAHGCCPVCCNTLSTVALLARQIVDQMQISCRYVCGHACKIEAIVAHEDTCVERPVVCDDCRAEMPAKTLRVCIWRPRDSAKMFKYLLSFFP